MRPDPISLCASLTLTIMVAQAQGQTDGPSPGDLPKPPKFYGHDLRLRGCVVTGAHLVSAGPADVPLLDPLPFSVPAPGTPNTAAQGPSVGPEPGSNPATIFTGFAFEYHSDLNGQDGCGSEQYRQYMQFEIDKATGRLGRVNGDGINPALKIWPVDRVRPGRAAPFARSLFNLTTSSKPVPFEGGIVAEGTPRRIHWLDAPGYIAVAGGAGVNPAHALVQIALIKSVTYGSNHDHGWFCLSGHTVVVDLATGGRMAPADVTTMFGRATAGRFPSPLQKQAIDALSATPGAGGFQGTANPEFRNLGCLAF